MSVRRWRWIGASSIGSSHSTSWAGCEDRGGCLEIPAACGTTLVAVVSDGAGSASHSQIGSRIVVTQFCRAASRFVAGGGLARKLEVETVREWLDDVRTAIEFAALRKEAPRRAFAATLVGCIIQADAAAIAHVGDGACVLRLRGEQDWLVPSWPAQGEFAATTSFITDDPEPQLDVKHLSGDVADVALFSDGLERLALDFTAKTAFQGFFEPMFRAIPQNKLGRDRALSKSLRDFLGSSKINERTDDDKTIILAQS